MSNLIEAPQREGLPREEVKKLLDKGVLVTDPRRSRPWYFDGRFLAARDLTRDQNYALVRQADLGQAGGTGVISGLEVELATQPSTLKISEGVGISPSGEMLVLPQSVEVDLNDIPKIQRLDAAFGLHGQASTSPRNLSGLFVLALRAVEYTANPQSSYPTTVTGKRTVEDGDIIEASLISLIPYNEAYVRDELDSGRARVAREIFVQGSAGEGPVSALPLAMLALDNNTVEWIDTYMVRRDANGSLGWQVSLGGLSRSLREAHLQQYENRIQGLISGGKKDFAATDYFQALPPAGKMPSGIINTKYFTQSFFPPEVDVSLTVIPEDEIPAMLDDSLLLPPIDLTASPEVLEGVSVLITVPVPRSQLRAKVSKLLPGQTSVKMKAHISTAVANQNPLDLIAKDDEGDDPIDETTQGHWQEVLNSEHLWYTVRRSLPRHSDVQGYRVRVAGRDLDNEREFKTRLEKFELHSDFDNVKKKGTILASAEALRFLRPDRLSKRKLLFAGAVHELSVQPKLDVVETLKVADRFSAPNFGEGVKRLETADRDLLKGVVAKNLGKSKAIPELDRLGRVFKESELKSFTKKLKKEAAQSADKAGKFIRLKIKELE